MKTERLTYSELEARRKRDYEFAITARAFATDTRQQRRRREFSVQFAAVSSKWDIPRRERRAIARKLAVAE